MQNTTSRFIATIAATAGVLIAVGLTAAAVGSSGEATADPTTPEAVILPAVLTSEPVATVPAESSASEDSESASPEATETEPAEPTEPAETTPAAAPVAVAQEVVDLNDDSSDDATKDGCDGDQDRDQDQTRDQDRDGWNDDATAGTAFTERSGSDDEQHDHDGHR
ncbi:hypothetical protein [Demequina capsici]|uniref:Uncharacterized protein n=1 Tax=Demequina capsici TaxID=3075620 RepID=A0AA96F9H8_9MICO|nr:hypothetical protein [Demequina sp. OYTSA14]WNM24110.1 hypothetical protein RN606_12180 [Demequina sp. OYTSA14]